MVESTQLNDVIDPNEQHIIVHLPFGEMSIGERVPALPKSRAICYHCGQMLEFLSGPEQIRCSKCQQINAVPPNQT